MDLGFRVTCCKVVKLDFRLEGFFFPFKIKPLFYNFIKQIYMKHISRGSG